MNNELLNEAYKELDFVERNLPQQVGWQRRQELMKQIQNTLNPPKVNYSKPPIVSVLDSGVLKNEQEKNV